MEGRSQKGEGVWGRGGAGAAAGARAGGFILRVFSGSLAVLGGLEAFLLRSWVVLGGLGVPKGSFWEAFWEQKSAKLGPRRLLDTSCREK